MNKITYTLEIVTEKVGLEREEILRYVETQIISPYKHDTLTFDEEDLRRLELICELRETCNPNDESLQVMLHLIDQIHYLQNAAIRKK